MNILLDKIINEVDISILSYEDRIDLFNRYQIPAHVNFISPLLVVKSIMFGNISRSCYGFSHGGAILSNVNSDEPQSLRDRRIEYHENRIEYIFDDNASFRIFKNGNIVLQQKNVSRITTHYNMTDLKETIHKLEKCYEFLEKFGMLIK